MIATEVCYIQTNANSPILTTPLLHYITRYKLSWCIVSQTFIYSDGL